MTVTQVVVAIAMAFTVIFALVEIRAHPADHLGDARRSERSIVKRLARYPRLAHFVHRRLDPHAGSGLLVTLSFGIVAATAIVVGVLLDWVDSNDGLAELDSRLANWGSTNATDATTDLLSATTELGSTRVVAAALLIAGLVDFVRLRNWHVFSFLFLVGVGQLVLVIILKEIVSRTRPDILQLVEVTSPSFPSGHACAAAAGWGAVVFVLSRCSDRMWRSIGGAVAVAVAVAVAASRVLLGVHWLTDVLAGLAIGWGWTTMLIVLFSRQIRPIAPLIEKVGEAADHDYATTK